RQTHPDPLQARGKIWRLADDAAFLRLSGTHKITDHNEPRAIPTRVCSGTRIFSPATALVCASPARTAHPASPSGPCADQKDSGTLSHMYFATNPPKHCTVWVTHL